jgi:hypothetical protein
MALLERVRSWTVQGLLASRTYAGISLGREEPISTGVPVVNQELLSAHLAVPPAKTCEEAMGQDKMILHKGLSKLCRKERPFVLSKGL